MSAVPAMAFGALVATARLVGCVYAKDASMELLENPHASGPWLWLLEDIKRIEPIPMRGAQGLWDASPSASPEEPAQK